MSQLRVVQTGLDGQILNAQILIETMRVFKDRPIIGATLHPDGQRSNSLTRYKLPKSTLPYFGNIFTSNNLSGTLRKC